MFSNSAAWLVVAFCGLILVGSLGVALQAAWKFLGEYKDGMFRKGHYQRIAGREVGLWVIVSIVLMAVLAALFVVTPFGFGPFALVSVVALLISFAWLFRCAGYKVASADTLREHYRLPILRPEVRSTQVVYLGKTEPLPIVNLDDPNGPLIPREPIT